MTQLKILDVGLTETELDTIFDIAAKDHTFRQAIEDITTLWGKAENNASNHAQAAGFYRFVLHFHKH